MTFMTDQGGEKTYKAALGRGLQGPGEMVPGVPYRADGRVHEYLRRRRQGVNDAEYTHWQRAQTDDGSGIVAYDYLGPGQREQQNLPEEFELPPQDA